MAFTISEGQVASSASGHAIPRSGHLQITDNDFPTYAALWKRQPQIRTVVGFLSRNIAQMGIHVFKRVSDLDRERAADHPLSKLLARPNPYTTTFRLIEALVADIAIYDCAFWLKVRATEDANPALLRLDPAQVTLEGKNPFKVDSFRYGRRRFQPEDIVHFHGYSAIDNRTGTSPLESLRQILAEDFQASLFRSQLWRNGARLSGYIERPQGAPEWSRAGKEAFRAGWQAQYTGDGARPGGTPILEDGMKYVPAGTSPRDAQYIEARKLTREEVTSAYHIPLTLVGLLDSATYTNISEQHKIMYSDTLGPWLNMIQQEIALQLTPDFDTTGQIYAEFNLAEKLRGSFQEQAAQLQTAVGAPYMTRNEARARLNLPQIDDGAELITPLNVLVGGQASPRDSAPDPTERNDTPVPLRAVES